MVQWPAMRYTFIGAGAVGGFYGALLARQGHEVSFVARGAHRDAIAKDGLRVTGPIGDFTVKVRAESDPATLGPTDVVVVAVKTYDNDSAIPMVKPLLGPNTVVLPLQNGVDSSEAIAAAIGEKATLGGSTYIATAIEAPGLIKQTGTHRRIVFGEYFGKRDQVSDRVRAIEQEMIAADILAEAVADARPAVWEKFTYLAPFAAFTGASRLPIGPLWADEEVRPMFVAAVNEVRAVAAGYDVPLAADYLEKLNVYVAQLPASTRSSLLIDLSQGKRIEVEALQGSVVRRGRKVGVATPVMAALYAVLKPYANGTPASPIS